MCLPSHTEQRTVGSAAQRLEAVKALTALTSWHEAAQREAQWSPRWGRGKIYKGE